MSRTYQRLPSEILHIEDPYIAYSIDEAIFTYMLEKQSKEEPEGEEVQELSREDLGKLIGMRGVTFTRES